ncbi:symplekin [Nilaparvata lugens]|uniref:symplekin n=1 Tax=Nilaparvata lugens TaxID=108931 RepID=UPI00193D8B76|nr:symplekin [Nilaparvata lugens]XP_039293524.1 symplekin [Nilaparvata lugens]XP_039293525.1 symplekin [Nilaparvata lugens]
MAFHRSPAAQYFLESQKKAGSYSKDDKSSEQKVVEWINEASLSTDANRKIELLRMVQEFIIHKEPHILDNFLHEVVGFQIDKNAEVRKFIVGFIEEACKKDSELLPKVVPNLQMLLQDSCAQVQKRVIQAASQVYRCTLNWVCKATHITEQMKAVWLMMCNIKKAIVDLVDSDNDGIRTHTVKFLETLVLCQTYPEEDSLQRENDFSLEDIPLGMKIARRRKLEEEALTLFSLMVKFHGSEHISSVNLMTCMGSLTLIAKMRPTFMGKVVAALETLHMNLPPTLSKSQVSSVRKHLKLQLLNLLKHPKAADYLNNITTLLTDLGATYNEVMKAYPKDVPVRRKSSKRPAQAESESAKKLKVEEIKKEAAEDSGGEEERRGVAPSSSQTAPVTETSIDLTEKYIVERLSPEFTADLVIMAMNKLPDSMPSVFSATYTPIAAAGTQGQIRHVARLLATQIAVAGLGPGNAATKGKTPWKDFGKKRPLEEDDDEEEEASASMAVDDPKTANLPAVIQMPSKRSRRSLKLNEITKPLTRENREAMSVAAVKRILVSEKRAIAGGVLSLRCKMVATMATSFNPVIRQAILDHILSDVKNNLLLGLSCLYEEYAYLQSFKRLPSALIPDQKKRDQNYGNLLKSFVETLINKNDLKERDMLLFRLFLEAPLITDEVVEILKQLSSRDVIGLTILQELVIRRPPKQIVYLNALLTYTSHESTEIRGTAISYIVMLYDRGELRSIIEEYSVMYLDFLRLPLPPPLLFGVEQGRTKPDDLAWHEDAIKACLYLYLVLLPTNHKLIHELARVYVQTIPDIKRIILRLVEVPVRGMGMDSPQLLSLVEDCPKGSETLVTRIIHILTDKGTPSPELVAKVRELYQTRVSDVRFLIPVLNGLTKKEVIAALPKLIKLNPIVVKEVFNRLLGTHAEAGHSSPVSPAELLIALHNIDPTKCELKTVIKATSMCFAEKSAYTQEVLAVVMQNLMEISPLPTLLMRTVIQSLSLYPRLIGFVINILQRLILKQVWKQKKVWEGFIKCCQRTKPQSFQVLLQLPATQLADVFDNSPDLKQPLLNHVMSFTDNQRAHIPQTVMDIIMGPDQPIYPMYTVKNEPMSPPELMIDIKDEPSDEAKLKAAQHHPEPVQPNVEPAPPGAD